MRQPCKRSRHWRRALLYGAAWWHSMQLAVPYARAVQLILSICVQPLFNSILGFNLKASTALSHTTVSVSAIASSLYGFYQVRMLVLLSVAHQHLRASAYLSLQPGACIEHGQTVRAEHALECKACACDHAGLMFGPCCRRAPTTRRGPWQTWTS